MSSITTNLAPKGLEGVVATTSRICYIDGDRGVLAYRGIDIHELAGRSNFEETCYLLWFGTLPTLAALRDLRDRMAQERTLDPAILTLLRTAPGHALPMDVLRTASSALSFYDHDDKNNDHNANIAKAIRLTSQIAMIVAAYDRIRKRHFDVQLMGGAALHLGNIAEMKTGEGKTLTSVLPAYLNALAGNGVHVVTVNDYLAKRDSERTGRVHRFLGLRSA